MAETASKNNFALKRILPVQTEKNEKEKRLLQRRWQADRHGRFFPIDLSAGQLKKALENSRVKLQNFNLHENEEYLIYKYKDRPTLILNRKDGQFYSPNSEIKLYGQTSVQNQAHLIIHVLKKSMLTSAKIEKASSISSAKQVLGKLKTYGS
jgi:hypothetical protein